LIYPIDSEQQDHCCILFPVGAALSVFQSPGGQMTGKMIKTVEDMQIGDISFKSYTLHFVDGANDSTNVLDIFSSTPISSENMALTFYDRQGDYVQLMHNAGPYWVNTKDLEAIGLKAYGLQEYMTLKSGDVLGFYPEVIINLRNGPSATAERIATLSYLHEIVLTGEHQGAWSKVKVIKLSEDRCLGGEEIEGSALEGWIKAIDDEGWSNIWYYAKGC
jgi:hypothetical protein